MRLLRFLLCVLLLAGLLPWGAYLGAGLPARDASAGLSTAIEPDTSGDAAILIDAATQEQSVQRMARRCQRTALPGGPCAADLWLPAEMPQAVAAAVPSPHRLTRFPRFHDWTPPAALDPPRFG